MTKIVNLKPQNRFCHSYHYYLGQILMVLLALMVFVQPVSAALSDTQLKSDAPLFVKETSKVSYLLWLSSEGQRKKLETDDKPNLDLVQINQAQTNLPVLINLILSPLEGQEGQNAKIVYDLTIIRPDGTPYEGTPLKGLTAFEGQWPQKGAFAINGPDQISLRFETTDPFGNYRIVLDSEDQISGHKTRLEAVIKHTKPSKP